jgi:RNA polymerase sigma-70 factor (ECF subfamily)
MKSFKAWVFQVARNLCLNRIRSRRRALRAIETEARTTPDAPVHAEGLLAAREAPEALRRAVARLPAPMARLYELRASGLSYEEIAHVLEVPVGTVKSRMHEMVSRLRKEVVPWTAT